MFFPPSVTGLIGGYQAGYNRQLANNVVLGVEADVSFGSPVDIPRLAPAPFNTTIDYIATARGRVGYAMGTWMPYVTGGLAWGRTHVNLNDLGVVMPPQRIPHPCSAGPRASASNLPSAATGPPRPNTTTSIWRARTYDLTDVALPRVNVDPNIHLFKLGLNYRLWETPPWIGAGAGRRTHRAAGIDRLERPRPDHVHRARLSAHALAL